MLTALLDWLCLLPKPKPIRYRVNTPYGTIETDGDGLRLWGRLNNYCAPPFDYSIDVMRDGEWHKVVPPRL